MKFTIITPTYNRWDLLERCIKSVLSQTYNNFEMIIIDDSTDNVTKNNISKYLENENIKYLKNNKNRGVNYSRNRGLDNVSNKTDFITYLDDDDYFDKHCLEKAKEVILSRKNSVWFLSNKADQNGKKITKVLEYNIEYNYLDDYEGKIKGDATHFLKWDKVKNYRFSKIIKQGWESVYWAEIGVKYKFYTYDFNSIYIAYLEGGLTKAKKNILKGVFFFLLALFEVIFIRKYSFINKLIITKMFIFKNFLIFLKKINLNS